MSLATYSDLLASALSWMERTGVDTSVAPDWVTLAEAKLNRKLGPVEVDANLTGVADSRSLDLSALSIVQPIALFVAEPSSEDEAEVQQQAAANLAYSETTGRPSQWCMDSVTTIKFDRPCDQAYAFRFRYRQRFALSDSVTTNWLLENHPDIYLAATMMWGAGYNQDWANGQVWKQALDEGLDEVAGVIAESRRGTLTVDPALLVFGRRC